MEREPICDACEKENVRFQLTGEVIDAKHVTVDADDNQVPITLRFRYHFHDGCLEKVLGKNFVKELKDKIAEIESQKDGGESGNN